MNIRSNLDYHINNIHPVLQKLPLFRSSGKPDEMWVKLWVGLPHLAKEAHNVIVLNLKGIPVISNLRRYSRVNQVTARVSINANMGLSIVLPWLSCSTGVVRYFQGEHRRPFTDYFMRSLWGCPSCFLGCPARQEMSLFRVKAEGQSL